MAEVSKLSCGSLVTKSPHKVDHLSFSASFNFSIKAYKLAGSN
jgi:hypothetical protein